MSGQLKQLEFTIISHVRNVIRGTAIPVGILMLESGNSSGFVGVQFVNDWTKMEAIEPETVELLQALERDFRVQLADPVNRYVFLQKLQDACSGQIQLSPLTGCLAEDPVAELSILADLYLTSPVTPKKSNASTGTKLIRHQMKSAFAAAGAIVMEDIPVSEYTISSDPFKFDFGYRTSGDFKLFQAVSLKSDTRPAILIGSRFSAIAVAMQLKVHKVPKLTVVIDDDLDRSKLDQYKKDVRFALEIMQNASITIVPVSEMPRIAQRARMEISLN